MKGKLLLGSVLMIVGFLLAVLGSTIIGRPPHIRETSRLIVGDQNQPARDEIASLVFPSLRG